MEIGGRYIPKSTAALLGVLILVIIGGGVYFATKGGSSSNGGSNSATKAPTITLPSAATQAPTIATGKGAGSKISGHKLEVKVSPTPQISSGQWKVVVNVQGGKNRNQTLGSKPLTPTQPFVISNDANGAYTVTPEILNCAKDCSAKAAGYTLPPLTVNPHKSAQITILAVCKKSPLPIGIDCSRSQVLSAYSSK